MPIYEFHCEECQQEFECLLLGSDKPECSSCKSKNVKRLMSVCGHVSKGSGGEPSSSSASSSGCGSCSASSCAGCGH